MTACVVPLGEPRWAPDEPSAPGSWRRLCVVLLHAKLQTTIPQRADLCVLLCVAHELWSSGIYDQWPYRITWADSSRAKYGLEGGTGPNWLAYVRIPGQECLYNVWSRRGRAHLEELLGSLRFVSER